MYFHFICILVSAWMIMMVTASDRIECDPRAENTIPYHFPEATYDPEVFYGGNLVCGLTCNGSCDASPAFRPELKNAFKCQCPLVGGCDALGPLTQADTSRDVYPLCTKQESCNCEFQVKEPGVTYECYHCKMQPNNWAVYYTCCPIPIVD